jgi:hypothetical protein
MKIYLYLIFAIFLLTVFPNCKKGDNDPFLSFRSRDSRITGKWKVVNYEYVEINGNDSYSLILNGSTITQTVNGNITSYPFSSNLEILENGTYKSSSNINGEISNTINTWHWFDDTRKKTRLLLQDGGVFVVDRLTNNELVLKSNEQYSSSSSGSSNFQDYSYTLSFEKE